MLVCQESIIRQILKEGLVENSVFKVEGTSAEFQLSESYSLILKRITNAYGYPIHELHLSIYDAYEIHNTVNFNEVINCLNDLLSNAGHPKGKVQEIIGSLKRVLYDDLFKIHQENFIKELIKRN